MKGLLTEIKIDERNCRLYLPPGYNGSGCSYPVVYMNGTEEICDIMERIEPHIEADCEAFILLAAEPLEWNDDFSPWPAPALSDKSRGFGGCAAAYLEFLSQTVKPYLDASFHTRQEPENTAIIGYSLGGLAALLAMYTCPIFGRFASLSGSLWFDGWAGFMESGTLKRTDSRVYISLGKGETRSRNPRMASVGENTMKTAEILKTRLFGGGNLLFRLNEGGHFTDIAGRHELALTWLMKPWL
ncbi:MAG TPA: alpha/beta hydrolase-fold protein [Clostridia bacterium]|nr:alpha/beta hydrolase-fold protein [Clostridia bacterium]